MSQLATSVDTPASTMKSESMLCDSPDLKSLSSKQRSIGGLEAMSPWVSSPAGNLFNKGSIWQESPFSIKYQKEPGRDLDQDSDDDRTLSLSHSDLISSEHHFKDLLNPFAELNGSKSASLELGAASSAILKPKIGLKFKDQNQMKPPRLAPKFDSKFRFFDLEARFRIGTNVNLLGG